MVSHYDYRLRVNVKSDQPEATTLRHLKTEGASQPEAYQVVSALQVFYGTEAALATGSEAARSIALESIGLLLEQCVVVAEQGGIDLEALVCEPEVLGELIRQAVQRRDPLRRSRKRVSVTERVTEKAQTVPSNGRVRVAPTVSEPAPFLEARETTQPDRPEQPVQEATPTTPPSRPKRGRMF